MEIIFVFILTGNLILVAVTVYNFFTAPFVKKRNDSESKHLSISVLIPARNEAERIEKLLESLSNQTYPITEIIVLNDHSTDKTVEVVYSFKSKIQNLRLIDGKELPAGWLGKNWACQQLAENAKGAYLLFLDADVYLEAEAIQSLSNTLIENKLDMLSVFPTQIISSFGEWLVVPLMNWILLSLLPLKKVFTSNNKSFVAANGQTILITKSAYQKIGEHNKVKDDPVEDMGIARLIKKNDYKMMTLLGDRQIFCSMYNDFLSAVEGYKKNFYPGFKMNPVLFLLIVVILTAIVVFPLIGVFFNYIFIWTLILVVINRLLVSLLSRQSVFFNILFHQLQFVVMLYVGVLSVIQTKRKNLSWKGRKLA